MSEKLNELVGGITLVSVLVLNQFLAINAGIVIQFALVFGILFHGWILGKLLLPRSQSVAKTLFGIVLFLGIFSVGMTAWFYSGNALDENATTLILAATMALCQAINLVLPEKTDAREKGKTEPWNTRRILFAVPALAVSTVSLMYILVGATRAATTNSIRTPWPLLPPGTLVALAFAWVAVLLTIWLVRSRALSAFQSGLAIFATTSIVPLVYRLGFGFDGFLHLAGEKHILATGTLNPKPLYYIGQYVFTTWLSRVSDFPIESIDRWLVPIAVAILIPFAVYVAMGHPLHLFGVLLIPLAPFVATTPQSFAYVLGLAAILLAFGDHQDIRWPAPLILAAWSVAAHPLARIPITLVVFAILLARDAVVGWQRTARLASAWVMVIASGFAVPILFVASSLRGSTPIGWNLSLLWSSAPWSSLVTAITPWIGNSFVVWPAVATIFTIAIPTVALVAAIGGILLSRDARRMQYCVLTVSGVVLFLSGAALKTAGDFAFLIDYERGNYAERLFVIGTFCLVIAALPAVAWLIERSRQRPTILSFLLVVALGTIAAAQTYQALPRNDALVTGHGWTVGSADIEAAKSIDRDAAGAPYTVLANQSVSAAAVSVFGFKRYHGDIFFYPIPTGGPLYEKYLDMTYKEPSRDTARDAARLGGSTIVYVVLNDYWWNAQQVGDSLSVISDAEWTTGTSGSGIGTSDRVYKFIF